MSKTAAQLEAENKALRDEIAAWRVFVGVVGEGYTSLPVDGDQDIYKYQGVCAQRQGAISLFSRGILRDTAAGEIGLMPRGDIIRSRAISLRRMFSPLPYEPKADDDDDA